MANLFIINYHKIYPRYNNTDVSCGTLDLEFSLLRRFFDVVTIDDVCEYVRSGRPPKRRSVAITFDDGYLDTYVYAFPLLKKHRLKASLFCISSRINDSSQTRPTLDDYWKGSVCKSDLYNTDSIANVNSNFLITGDKSGFCTSGELRAMKGVMEIGSHAEVHARIFCKDVIADCRDGTNGHWSDYYSYAENPLTGFPVFPSCNSIASVRGYLKKEVKDFIKSIGKEFFSTKDWKKNLQAELEKRFNSFLDFESEADHKKRVCKELINSKEALECYTGAPVNHFSYPFGHFDSFSYDIVKQLYISAFTTEIDIVRKTHDLHLIPRAKMHRDPFSFTGKLIKLSLKEPD
jgi:peptidoglycan/xylan/chitin deacetylase (PgdA/CDA1 family)